MNLKQGTILQGGKYRIERELGHGGFGVTYLATQVGLNRKVAIKEFFMSEYCNRDADTSQVTVGSEGSKELVTKFRKKFIKEAQNIACLKHPHIISIHDVFEDNGTAYYVMEYLDHGSLADVVKRHGRLSEADALRYIRQIADALRYIHERKMNHLDVKPGNILIDETDHAVLIDFGLSKRYDDEGNQTSTTPVGISHGYAPLEQYKKSGVGTFSPATDIYSLGATLYKLITGATPPDANDVNDDGLPSFPAYVSATTAKTIEQAMQPRRKDRPQTVEAFLELFGSGNSQGESTILDDDDPTVLDDDDPIAKNRDKVHMDDVSSVSFLYCEPSFPGWGSYKAEITATSIQVEFAVMGNVVKQHSFPFSKNKFRELKLKLDTLDLHVKDVTGPGYYTGCSSIQLTLRGATHTFSAGCLCSGDGEWHSGELRGNISMLQKVMRQTIPDFDRLWQAAKSAAEPKPTPRPQPSPKPQPKKNKTESPEVKKQWWPLINVLLYCGIMLSTLVWVSEAHIPLPGWIVGLLLVGMIGGYALFNKGRKRWGYVAWYAPLLLMLLWALLNMNAGEEEKIIQEDSTPAIENKGAIQGRSVNGVMLNLDGEPIIGASVVVKGTSLQALTDIDGKFAIANIPNDATTLKASYVGMKTKEVPIQPSVVIIMEAKKWKIR